MTKHLADVCQDTPPRWLRLKYCGLAAPKCLIMWRTIQKCCNAVIQVDRGLKQQRWLLLGRDSHAGRCLPRGVTDNHIVFVCLGRFLFAYLLSFCSCICIWFVFLIVCITGPVILRRDSHAGRWLPQGLFGVRIMDNNDVIHPTSCPPNWGGIQLKSTE